MATKTNFMLKVIDARAGEIQKILKQAGIQVVSIIEVHKEDMPEPKPEETASAQQN